MLEREKPVGILRKATDRIVSAIRGYSAKDLESAIRAMSGIITPEDRERFRSDEAQRLGLMHFGLLTPTGSPDFNPPFLPIGMSFSNEIARIQTLTEDQLNTQIRNQAEERLRQWGKL